MRGGAAAILTYRLLIEYSAACDTPLSPRVKVHRRGIGIPLRAQLCWVNIYRGDWCEAIRSGGPVMITEGERNWNM